MLNMCVVWVCACVCAESLTRPNEWIFGNIHSHDVWFFKIHICTALLNLTHSKNKWMHVQCDCMHVQYFVWIGYHKERANTDDQGAKWCSLVTSIDATMVLLFPLSHGLKCMAKSGDISKRWCFPILFTWHFFPLGLETLRGEVILAWTGWELWFLAGLTSGQGCFRTCFLSRTHILNELKWTFHFQGPCYVCNSC